MWRRSQSDGPDGFGLGWQGNRTPVGGTDQAGGVWSTVRRTVVNGQWDLTGGGDLGYEPRGRIVARGHAVSAPRVSTL